MKAFARFENEIWGMDVASVDKLPKENISLQLLLIRQKLSDRTLNAKGMKTKNSQETVREFSTMITSKIRHNKMLVDKETKFAGKFNYRVAQGIQIYSTMS